MCRFYRCVSLNFFFNATATTEIYTLSLHDALPISYHPWHSGLAAGRQWRSQLFRHSGRPRIPSSTLRSEEHTSELQSRLHLVCRLLLEKKKKKKNTHYQH